MQHYSIIITPQASTHLDEIEQYVSIALKEPVTAKNLISTLLQKVSTLAFMPNRFPLLAEEPWKSDGVRKFPAGNFIVYYWINEARNTVYITAVIYGRRDQKQALEELELS